MARSARRARIRRPPHGGRAIRTPRVFFLSLARGGSSRGMATGTEPRFGSFIIINVVELAWVRTAHGSSVGAVGHALYCIVLYSTVLYMYCTVHVLYCTDSTVLSVQYITVQYRYRTVRYFTVPVLYCTVLYCTVQ